jgi:DNA repair protein RadC
VIILDIMDKDQFPRERLVKFGSQNLKDYELLAILLRTGTKEMPVLELSKEILKLHPLDIFQTVTVQDLLKIKGISHAKATTIVASLELSRRILEKPQNVLPLIDSAHAAVATSPELASSKREKLVALYLNASNYLIHKEIITIGTLDKMLVNPRDILEPGIRYLAGFIILLHNHPAGDLEPSEEDLEFTKNLEKGAKLLGLELMDHILIGKGDFRSILTD